MNNLLQTVISIIGLVALAVGGIFGIVGVVDKFKKDRDKEIDNDGMRLVTLLKESVGQLEGKVKALEIESIANKDKMSKMEARNEVLESIFQGRDQATTEFQRQGFEVMKMSKDMFAIVQQTNLNVEKLYKAIEKHLSIIEKDTAIT